MSKIKELGRRFFELPPIGLYCAGVNMMNVLKKRDYRVRVVNKEGLYQADDGHDKITLCRRGRHKRYKRGVMQGVENLARQYHLDKLETGFCGTFIDCGANIGELGLWAGAKGFKYIAIEPEKLEADCSDLNNFGGRKGTNRVALWKEDTTLEFFSMPETADSSVFDMGSDTSIKIPAVQLDNLVDLDGQDGINIFKLEAEGAEPEVLEGARKTLKNIDYVAVDCGYERGKEQQHTFIEVNRFLSEFGFEPIEAGFHRVTILYKNKSR